MLDLCITPQPKTKILFRAKTNSRMLEQYLGQLQKAQLLQLNATRRLFYTTPKGTEFIQTWVRLQEIIQSDQNVASLNKKYEAGQENSPMIEE